MTRGHGYHRNISTNWVFMALFDSLGAIVRRLVV
jgi:hypothetical protein